VVHDLLLRIVASTVLSIPTSAPLVVKGNFAFDNGVGIGAIRGRAAAETQKR
jgi:hypothetical protein